MTSWIPDFCTIKGAADNNARVQCEAGIRPQLFVDVDPTLGINGNFEGVARKRTLLIAVHLAAAHLFDCIPRYFLKGLCSENVDALVAANREVTAGFQTGTK
ncbi:unannotated protein [freshwater metagenome]|uniref:Unannotated protein n=1 Tax=freshwater metagenome TaxID=449393 RepID=A0A6J6KSW3_9ZZZZ